MIPLTHFKKCLDIFEHYLPDARLDAVHNLVEKSDFLYIDEEFSVNSMLSSHALYLKKYGWLYDIDVHERWSFNVGDLGHGPDII
jgi:hypothetical protein